MSICQFRGPLFEQMGRRVRGGWDENNNISNFLEINAGGPVECGQWKSKSMFAVLSFTIRIPELFLLPLQLKLAIWR